MPDWVSFAGLVTLGIAFIAGVARFSRWSGQVDADRSNFKEFMAKVENKLQAILDRLPPRLVAGAGPVRLTDLGEQAGEEMGTRAWAATVAPDLLDKVQGLPEFEIYEFCSDYVNNLKDEEIRKKIAACAYNHGTDRSSVLTVLMVVLRDELLKLLKLVKNN